MDSFGESVFLDKASYEYLGDLYACLDPKKAQTDIKLDNSAMSEMKRITTRQAINVLGPNATNYVITAFFPAKELALVIPSNELN